MPPKRAPRKGRTAAKKAEKIAAKQPTQPFTLTKEQFDSDISNLCYEAWKNRGSEHHLYPVYNHILSVNCATLHHRNTTRVSIAPCPQPLLGPIPPPVPLGHTIPPKLDDEKTPLPSQFPDFARILINSNPPPVSDGSQAAHNIIDTWELKPLNSGHLWWSPESRVDANRNLLTSLEQCQDQAEAGFAHNENLTHIYTLLVVGPYFTQLLWKDRPPKATLASVEIPEVPDTSDPVEPQGDYPEPVADLIKAIKHYEKRKVPEVLCYNAPVFTYHLRDPDSERYQPVSLSPEFLWALAVPLMHHFPDIPIEPTSWFYPETTTRPQMTSGDRTLAKTLVYKAVKGHKIEKLKQYARSLGHRFPGDKYPAVTPSPPVSKTDNFPGRKRNVPNGPPLVTRASAKARATETVDVRQQQGDEADHPDAAGPVLFPGVVEDAEGEIAGDNAVAS